jgi:hypothetical protein
MDEQVHAPQGSYAELVMGRDRLRRDLERVTTQRDDLRAVLLQVAAFQQRTVLMLEREGFVFETRLDLMQGWEKLAFTLYSTICEIDAIARAGTDDEPWHVHVEVEP